MEYFIFRVSVRVCLLFLFSIDKFIFVKPMRAYVTTPNLFANRSIRFDRYELFAGACTVAISKEYFMKSMRLAIKVSDMVQILNSFSIGICT